MTQERLPEGLRRAPQQGRSAQRVELILDTLAAMIDEDGYHQVTPAALAKRAGMSGPAIYRYFDGVEAIGRALATRNLDRLTEQIVRTLETAELSWEDSMRRAVQLYCDFCRTEPGFNWLRLGDAIDRSLIEAGASNRTVLARRLTALFERRFAVDPRPDLLRHVEVTVEITDSLAGRAFEADPGGDPFFIRECQAVIVEYVRGFLERTASAPTGAPPADGSAPKRR